jgi:hypothetical protein
MDDTTKKTNLRLFDPDLAGEELGTWQPRCIARAFATPAEGVPVFMMQTWIDLDAASSPLLELQLPKTEKDLEAAVNAFRCGPIDLSPSEAVGLGLMMIKAIKEAFSMCLAMTPPAGEGVGGPLGHAAGFGDWLPIYAALIGQLGLSCAEASALRVGPAYALLAANKRNRGWMPAGATYAQRDAVCPPASQSPVNPDNRKEDSRA